MSLAFVAFHMQDYQRDTMALPLEGHGAYFLLLQHCWAHGRIPLDDASRATICKVPVLRWRRELAPLVAGYFDANGENKRATAEIAKAEKLRLRQALAGHNGGLQSVARRAERQAMAQAVVNPRSSHGSSHGEAMVKPLKKEDITTTSSVAARTRASVAENPANSTDGSTDATNPSAVSVAETPASGLAEQAREAVQKTSDIGRGELEAIMRRKGWVR